MVHSVEALGLVVPLKEREVYHPQRSEYARIPLAQPGAHLKTQDAKLRLRLSLGAAKGKDNVSLLCSAPLCHLCQLLR